MLTLSRIIDNSSITLLPFCRKLFTINKKEISFFVIEKGITKKVSGNIGENLLSIAKKNNIDLLGACEGNCACSTCHIVLEQKLFHKIKPPKEEEEDMLELAFGLTSTSRLACQVKIDKNFEKTKIIIPSEERNVEINSLKKEIKSKH